MEALLIAEASAPVLLLGEEQLDGSFSAVRQQLLDSTGWPDRVLLGFLRRQPHLMALPMDTLQASGMPAPSRQDGVGGRAGGQSGG